MRNAFARLFLDHPREVREGYLAHMAASARFGLGLLGAAAAAFAHALVPGVCKSTASTAVRRMADELGGRADAAMEGRMRQAGVFDPGL